ncbi:MAG: cytochrome b [Granulosicoccus sp.]
MTSSSQPIHYRPLQKFLHWFVVLGVITQIAIHEPMVRVYEALSTGVTADTVDTYFAWMHVGVGTLVLLAVLLRLFLRYRYGVPGHAPGTSATQAKLANAMHNALYILLLGMVATGMATWNGIAPLGQVHFMINVILFFLVLAHAVAALYNQFVKKDGTMRRMMRRQAS